MPPQTCRKWSLHPSTSLLGNVEDDVARSGPLLFELTVADIEAGLPETLIDRATGCTAGSFIISAKNAESLTDSLAPFVNIELSDGQEMLMRFFDPRVLPFWFDAILLTYKQALTNYALRWFYWDSGLVLQELALFPPFGEPQETPFPMRLSQQQETSLLDACYPFTLIERFRKEDPEALANVPVAMRYAFFKDQLLRCLGYGLEGAPAIEGYCSLAMRLGADFDKHPLIAPAMSAVADGASLQEALASITESQWHEIEHASEALGASHAGLSKPTALARNI